jgi:hypothetical protein
MFKPFSAGTAAALGLFDGTGPDATEVLVKYTYYGDANPDGSVDGSDYTLIENGFNNHVTGWQNGDFNSDGELDGSDYTLIDNAFNKNASLATQFATSTAQISAPVSEPATGRLAVVLIGAGLWSRRYRVAARENACDWQDQTRRCKHDPP